MSTAPPARRSPLTRRRIRGALTIAVTLGAALGIPTWLVMLCDRAEEQRRGVEFLEEHADCLFWYDHKIRYDEQDGLPRVDHESPPAKGVTAWLRKGQRRDLFYNVAAVTSRKWFSHPFEDDDLRHLTAFPKLEALHINANGVTDRGAEEIARLRRLVFLSLSNCHITDEGLAPLASLPRLRVLAVPRAPVTDKGAAALASSLRLERLDLRETALTDVGLGHLAAIPKLEVLILAYTNVSDDGIASLCQMRRLRTLNLNGTQVTPSGAAKIQQALPECSVEHPSLRKQATAVGSLP